MKNFRIAVIPGDGIGNEVMEEGIKVLNKYAELLGNYHFTFHYYSWGCKYYLENGLMMPEDGLEILKTYDAILLGAVGDKSVPDHISLHGLLLKIRQGFKQNINLRPIKLLKGVNCPIKNVDAIDFVVIRENVEGEYAGLGSYEFDNENGEIAIQKSVFTKKNTEIAMKYAFEMAKKRNGKRLVTNVTKSNALNYSMVFWDKIFNETAKSFEDINIESIHVDALAMYFIQKPEYYDVLVASNLFGDIITDLGAALQGGLGFAASANINVDKEYPSMFEPVHGSAPDIAGKNIANPIAMIWTIKLMLDELIPDISHEILIEAIEDIMIKGDTLPRDLGGRSTTEEIGDKIVEYIGNSKN